MEMPEPAKTTKDEALEIARKTLLECAWQAEALKRECGSDPESPQAIRNAQYMDISHTARGVLTAIEQAQQHEVCLTDLKLFMITTAYEQGVGKGIQRINSNPYIVGTDEYRAWLLGYNEGLEKPTPTRLGGVVELSNGNHNEETCPGND